METRTIIELNPQDLKKIVKEVFIEIEEEKKALESNNTVYTINQVKNILKVSHTTVKKLIQEGIIKTTSDNRRIPAWSLDEYLHNKK